MDRNGLCTAVVFSAYDNSSHHFMYYPHQRAHILKLVEQFVFPCGVVTRQHSTQHLMLDRQRLPYKMAVSVDLRIFFPLVPLDLSTSIDASDHSISLKRQQTSFRIDYVAPK